MPEKPRTLATEIIARSQLFEIEQVDLCFSNGQQRRFERFRARGRGAVMIVPMLDHDTVLLVREYACGLDRYELGLPKGLLEAGEDILAAANREMSEEIGYAAHSLQALKTFSLAPGYVQNLTYAVLAQDLYPYKTEGDEPEPIEVVPWRLNELDQLIARDDFSEARSLAALYLAKHLMKEK